MAQHAAPAAVGADVTPRVKADVIADVIAKKRDGGALSAAQLQHFVQGLVDGSWADSQVAALAMATVLRGMNTAETVALTAAMTRSGHVLQWADAGLPGPVLDKHSTGGVGDKVSLLLAPIVAACGGVVPMVSGRGLGHTGGTLDKLQALPGYQVDVSHAKLLATLRTAGCAIVGANAQLAPADRRLYAIRDVTATVESVPLITASILSKKLAAGVLGLVLDVKVGSGAFMATLPQAQALAQSLVSVAAGAGLPARALITDMNQVLGFTAGNALEVQECIDLLTGGPSGGAGAAAETDPGGAYPGQDPWAQQAIPKDAMFSRVSADDRVPPTPSEPRLLALTLALAGEVLHLGALALSPQAGQALARRALESGAAAERFARMVAALGGPADVLSGSHLPIAPVQRPVRAQRGGVLLQVDVRALGQCVVQLGGGRSRPGQAIDPRVGLSAVLPLHTAVQAGDVVAVVHAAHEAAAEAASQTVLAALRWGEPGADPGSPAHPVLQRVLP